MNNQQRVERIKEVCVQHESGLLTDYEFLNAVVLVSVDATPPERGELDENTGLRY